MNDASNIRSTNEKVKLFRRFFNGLTDVYGTYDPTSGKACQIKASVTDHVILAHLCGRQPYGVYLLIEDQTRAVVADFDEDDLNRPIEFVRAAHHYRLPAYIERSKSKGYHVWLFFTDPGVLAWKARAAMRHILAEIQSPHIEVFPKQDALRAGIAYGNFINAPLFGRLVPQGRTVFLDPMEPTKPAASQWDLLNNIQPVAASLLDEIIELNELQPLEAPHHNEPAIGSERWQRAFGLPPCAQRMLIEGVSEHQRVSCFRLGVHLKRAGLPVDAAIAVLSGWAPKNTPQPGKRIITPAEIADQVQSAYSRDYRASGCEEPCVARFCSSMCPLYHKIRTRQKNSSWTETYAQGVAQPSTGASP